MSIFKLGGVDRSQRKLERTTKVDAGDIQGQAKLLRERMRSGELSDDRVELAAYLGDPLAREVLGDEAPEQGYEVKTLKGLKSWIYSFEDLGGRESQRRAAIAAAWGTLGVFEHWAKKNLDQAQASAPRQALELTERYILEPQTVGLLDAVSAAEDVATDAVSAAEDAADTTRSARLAAAVAAADAALVADPVVYATATAAVDDARYAFVDADYASYAAAVAMKAALAVFQDYRPIYETLPAADAAGFAFEAVDRSGANSQHLSPELRNVFEPTSENEAEAIQSVIKNELISWAIGIPEDDPIRKRVEAREG